MKKIYLIDDDEDDQLFFKDAVRSIHADMKCCTANNGKVALDYLRTTDSLPDIIFLDLNMPVMNGFEFLDQLKNEVFFNKINVGIFSTSNAEIDKAKAKILGAKFFLTKPNDFKILYKKLQSVLFADLSSNEDLLFT